MNKLRLLEEELESLDLSSFFCLLLRLVPVMLRQRDIFDVLPLVTLEPEYGLSNPVLPNVNEVVTFDFVRTVSVKSGDRIGCRGRRFCDRSVLIGD